VIDFISNDDSVVADLLATIRAAIDQNRMDLYLQPIVTLPQRKVRYYEALTRLRKNNDEVVPAAEFIAVAQNAGLLAAIDNMAMFRCVQAARRLLLESPDVGLFCNLSSSALSDNRTFPQLLEFLDANRAIAPSFILEFTQHDAQQLGSAEIDRLAALADRGFRFSLDNVTDLRIEPRKLAAAGFRFVKISAAMLLDRKTPATGNHVIEFVEALGRFGINLVADHIENDDAVVDLLDHDVRLGQGFLFSPPRAVRAEALRKRPT
jgi:cyclic-di-GMP phosphodiesterase TipF (flagellum assembly factor)